MFGVVFGQATYVLKLAENPDHEALEAKMTP